MSTILIERVEPVRAGRTPRSEAVRRARPYRVRRDGMIGGYRRGAVDAASGRLPVGRRDAAYLAGYADTLFGRILHALEGGCGR